MLLFAFFHVRVTNANLARTKNVVQKGKKREKNLGYVGGGKTQTIEKAFIREVAK